MHKAASIPAEIKIYHITHVQNLAPIVKSGCLWSDAKVDEQEIACTVVGMRKIKGRRLCEREVKSCPNTKVGDYVPFYFCPRSVMLFILHKGNHPELDYRGGQRPIVHLQADLYEVIRWAANNNRPWAFTTSNAGSKYTDYYNNLSDLKRINWVAVRANEWGDTHIKDGKQAEFLLHESFPWQLVNKIGVYDQDMQRRVTKIVGESPEVTVERAWYY